MAGTALVLGASGGVGGEVARALGARGWSVRGLARAPRSGNGIDWLVGDALDADTVAAAARGADAIVHAVNPPGYRDWDRLVMPMLRNSIRAAEMSKARLAFPGTIYNYDPARSPIISPDSPQYATTRKSRIRIEMETAIEQSGVSALILRAGDYFGPRAGNSWFSQGLVKPGKPISTILHPGKAGVGHAWAYLPDVGEAFARLLDLRDGTPRFARYHFAGFWDADGRQIAAAIGRAAGRDDIKVRRLPWTLLPLIGLFNTTMRETAEMRPFWENPVALDNASLVAAIGSEPHTHLDHAVHETLKALRCI